MKLAVWDFVDSMSRAGIDIRYAEGLWWVPGAYLSGAWLAAYQYGIIFDVLVYDECLGDYGVLLQMRAGC